MRRGFNVFLPFFCVIGMTLFLLPWCVFCAEQPTGPRMVMKERIHDFSAVKEGEVIEHAFLVFNQGDQVLEIREVRPG